MTPLDTPRRRPRDDGGTGFELGEVSDIVALVPGFFGFERFGGFGYFADHIAATLRSVLEVETRHRTPVIPLGTLPAGSLVARQRVLLDQLQFWSAHYRSKRIHLVTHSSGGLDAYFATSAVTLSGTAWTREQQAVRSQIASIVTMGAPFLGTTLSDTEVSAFLAGDRWLPPPARDVVSVVTGAVHLIKENRSALERAGAILSGWPAAFGVLRELTRHRELIGELSPKRMLQRYEGLQRDIHPQLSCFASYVHPPDSAHASALFLRLHDYTAQGADKPAGAELLEANKKLLENAVVIAAPKTPRPRLAASSSDGVVNTLRQLPPGVRPGEVAGLVVADHADLLGYFDRFDARTGKEQQVSIFRSGATFRDDQFFELFDNVAHQLL